MRGSDVRTESLFSYVSCEARVPTGHPLRPIRAIADQTLEVLSPDFERLYSKIGRPSIPPETLLRALLLQDPYSVRSERQLMEQLDYNLMFRWFVGMSMDAPIWDVTVFTKSRDRLLEGDIAARFMAAVLGQPRVKDLISTEHFSVDGTLIEAWTSMKSFKPKGGGENKDPGAGDDASGGTSAAPKHRNAERDFHGEKRSNDTHSSTTDPDVLLFKKGLGKASQLCRMGHLLMENRNGLIIDALLTQATGTAERNAALAMPERRSRRSARVTLGADKGYDVADFVARVRALSGVPHVAQNTTNRRSAIDGRTTRHPNYAVSQRVCKRIEECFGWMKTCGGMRKTRHKGHKRVARTFTLTAAACNLIRLPKPLAAA